MVNRADNKKRLNRRKLKRGQGLCWDCLNEAKIGFTRCSKHLYDNSKSAKDSRLKYPEKIIEESQRKRQYRRANGLCASCGMPRNCGDGVKRVSVCINCSEELYSQGNVNQSYENNKLYFAKKL